MNLSSPQIRMFERLSGWRTKEHFEAEHEGYVTIEKDLKTGHRDAFLWTVDGNNHHVLSMWFVGQHFYKHGH